MRRACKTGLRFFFLTRVRRYTLYTVAYKLPLQSFQNENKWASLNCRISSRSGGYLRVAPAPVQSWCHYPLHAIYLNPFEQFFIFYVRTISIYSIVHSQNERVFTWASNGFRIRSLYIFTDGVIQHQPTIHPISVESTDTGIHLDKFREFNLKSLKKIYFPRGFRHWCESKSGSVIIFAILWFNYFGENRVSAFCIVSFIFRMISSISALGRKCAENERDSKETAWKIEKSVSIVKSSKVRSHLVVVKTERLHETICGEFNRTNFAE